MQASRPITVDLSTGVVVLGGTRVVLERDGDHYVAPGGLRARVLTFEERSGVIAGALMDREPKRALLSRLRNLAGNGNDTDEALADALLLALAGGGENAPAFHECLRLACQHGRLDWNSVQRTPAVVVDQFAASNEDAAAEGWTRFEFVDPSPSPLSLADCCQQMLDRLLERGTSSGSEPSPDTEPEGGDWQAQQNSANAQECSRTRSSSAATPQTGPVLRALAKFSPSNISCEPIKETLGTVSSRRDSSQEMVSPHLDWRAPQSDRLTHSLHNISPAPSDKESTALADDWSTPPTSVVKSRGSLADRVTAASKVAPPTAASVQTISPPKMRTIPVPAKARIRTHRLRDLPARIEPVPSLQQESSSSASPLTAAALSPTPADSTSAASVHPVPLQRDWMFEIASALADECDLRGLDT
jgi:hypothetical protein